MNNSEL